MSSKKIYQQFIRRTASEGKSIVAWDANRRYEGVFKQFDPTGEFVILANVWVSEGQETIFVSEMLLPLDSLNIVSAGLPIETFEEETYEEFGAVYPTEVSQEAETPLTFQSAMETEKTLTSSPTETGERSASLVERSKESDSTAQMPIDSATSKLVNLPLTSTSSPPTAPDESISAQSSAPSVFTSGTSKSATVPPSSKEAKIAAEPLVTTSPGEVKSSDEKKDETQEEKTAPIQKVKTGFEKIPRFFQKVFKKKAKQEYSQDVARKIPPTPAYRSSQPRRTFPSVPPVSPRVTVPGTPPPAAHPQVIQRRSAQVSTSSFFSQPVPYQADIPKQKVDIGTLILDILIGILTLVVIAIVAMGFLGIKIPSLPF